MKRRRNKRAQEENLQLNKNVSNLNFSVKHKSTKAQEEMVGFALIIIIVAVILLFLLSFSLKRPEKENVESYEVDSFIQATLQYTAECGTPGGKVFSVQELIFLCDDEKPCFEAAPERSLDEIKSCDVLNETLSKILKESWKTGEEKSIKGYELKIASNSREILFIKEGNITGNYKGALQDLPGANVSLNVYY